MKVLAGLVLWLGAIAALLSPYSVTGVEIRHGRDLVETMKKGMSFQSFLDTAHDAIITHREVTQSGGLDGKGYMTLTNTSSYVKPIQTPDDHHHHLSFPHAPILAVERSDLQSDKVPSTSLLLPKSHGNLPAAKNQAGRAKLKQCRSDLRASKARIQQLEKQVEQDRIFIEVSPSR